MTIKSSKVVTPTVSAEQFAGALNNIRVSGNSAKLALVTACKFIAQATNYTEQAKARKELATAYKAFQDSISVKPITKESANKWVGRSVKALSGDVKFKWLTSTSAKAKAMAKSRKARQPATTAPATTAPATTAPAEKLTSIEQYRNAIIAKENEILDNYRNLIPAGKREKLEQIFAMFIDSIKETLV